MSSRCKNAMLIFCVYLIFILRHAYLVVILSVYIRQEPFGFLLVNKTHICKINVCCLLYLNDFLCGVFFSVL